MQVHGIKWFVLEKSLCFERLAKWLILLSGSNEALFYAGNGTRNQTGIAARLFRAPLS
jgi:hypothetical protein